MNNAFRPVVIMVAVSQLKSAGFNPKDRTERRHLMGLVEGIREVDGIIQPLIISADFIVMDGHRRLAAAQMLGIAEVPCIVSPLSLQVGWRVLNQTSRTVTGRDWVQAHYLGMSLSNIAQRPRREIEKIKELVGDDGFEKIALAGMASNVVTEARHVAKYIDGKVGRQKCDPKTHKEVLLWMVECGQQSQAKARVRDGISPVLLKMAVNSREKLGR